MHRARGTHHLAPRLDRLKEARARRGIAPLPEALHQPAPARRRDDITIAGIVDRRARCRKCKYPFDYRMYGMVCPECGTLRDDYPARLISIPQFIGACAVGIALFTLVMWWMAS